MEDRLEKNRVFYALFTTTLVLVLVWGVQLMIEFGGAPLWRRAGNHPQDISRIWGIFTMPFIHGSWEHILNNTASFAVLNTLLFYFYRELALKVWLYIFLFSGVFVWFFGVPGSNHIGTSGVVYGLAFFLFSAGLLSRRNILLIRVSMLVLFLYGSIIWGIFPIEERVSWEGHLGGAIAGVLLAVIFRDELPKRPKTTWEIEEELELLKAEKDENNPTPPNGKTPIVQVFRQFKHRNIDRGF